MIHFIALSLSILFATVLDCLLIIANYLSRHSIVLHYVIFIITLIVASDSMFLISKALRLMIGLCLLRSLCCRGFSHPSLSITHRIIRVSISSFCNDDFQSSNESFCSFTN